MRAAFVQFSGKRTGSTFSGLLVVKALLESGVSVDAIFAEPGDMVAEYEAIGCSTQVLAHKSAFRSLKPLIAIRNYLDERKNADEFAALFASTKPDFVYINTSVSAAAALGAAKRGVPVLWHLREMTSTYGGEVKLPNRIFRYFLSRLLRRRADASIAISKAVANDLLGRTELPGLAIVPNAVGDNYFTSPEQGALPVDLQGGTIVGVPGTLRPMKGHGFFIGAVPKILAANDSCQFVVSGTGDESYVEQLKRRVRDLNVEDRVHFVGTIKDMVAFYDACDIVVVPSRQEPFGRTVIEAFARKRAVVASAVGGLCETIRDRENGLLVEYGDTSALANAVTLLLEDGQLRARLVSSGYEDAGRLYTEDVYKNRIREVVQRLLLSV